MTATILAFPTPLERDQIEFDRTGTSSLIRAFDEALALWEAVSARSGQGLAKRIETFTRAVARLASYRPDDLDDMVLVSGGGQIALAAMPGALKAAAAPQGRYAN